MAARQETSNGSITERSQEDRAGTATNRREEEGMEGRGTARACLPSGGELGPGDSAGAVDSGLEGGQARHRGVNSGAPCICVCDVRVPVGA